jgi:hypothetical protein
MRTDIFVLAASPWINPTRMSNTYRTARFGVRQVANLRGGEPLNLNGAALRLRPRSIGFGRRPLFVMLDLHDNTPQGAEPVHPDAHSTQFRGWT